MRVQPINTVRTTAHADACPSTNPSYQVDANQSCSKEGTRGLAMVSFGPSPERERTTGQSNSAMGPPLHVNGENVRK